MIRISPSWILVFPVGMRVSSPLLTDTTRVPFERDFLQGFSGPLVSPDRSFLPQDQIFSFGELRGSKDQKIAGQRFRFRTPVTP